MAGVGRRATVVLCAATSRAHGLGIRFLTSRGDKHNICNKIGFIGAGNMAKAIMGGIIRNGVQQPKNVMVYDISRDQVDSICLAFPGVQRASTLHELVKDADIVLLGTDTNALRHRYLRI
jgi:ornithine cyclodeaminase/alanine dehydrogenase-like protein (mu-crystallin family)